MNANAYVENFNKAAQAKRNAEGRTYWVAITKNDEIVLDTRGAMNLMMTKSQAWEVVKANRGAGEIKVFNGYVKVYAE